MASRIAGPVFIGFQQFDIEPVLVDLVQPGEQRLRRGTVVLAQEAAARAVPGILEKGWKVVPGEPGGEAYARVGRDHGPSAEGPSGWTPPLLIRGPRALVSL